MIIWICRWRMNTLVTSQYQPRLSNIANIFSRRIIQSDLNIQIKLNYIKLISVKYLLIRKFRNYQTKTSVAVPSQDLDFQCIVSLFHLFCVQTVKEIGICSFCWHWWNCWQSMLILSLGERWLFCWYWWNMLAITV